MIPLSVSEPIESGPRGCARAFLLGGIVSSAGGVEVDSDGRVPILIRHNPGAVDAGELNAHKQLLSLMLDGYDFSVSDSADAENARVFRGKPGFVIRVKLDQPYHVTELLTAVQSLIGAADDDAAACFLSGFFDGRGSVDTNSNYLVVDALTDDGAELAAEVLARLGIGHNLNLHRDRVEGGNPRKPQLRAHPLELQEHGIVVVSPCRRRLTGAHLQHRGEQVAQVLPAWVVEAATGGVAEGADEMLDAELVRAMNLPGFVNETGPSRPSDHPEPRQEPVVTGGQNAYPRSTQMAAEALRLADYKCEIDSAHPTFTRRSTGQPYCEPHHLVPMAASDCYEYSLDVPANIVALCSRCHDEIHYGRDGYRLVEQLLQSREERLAAAGIDVDESDLRARYGGRR